jgi:dTDP-4-dehydrorhamnose reductase
MKHVLITGSKGQLGQAIQRISKNTDAYHFHFTDIEELNITDEAMVNDFIRENDIKICINCGAYTQVDKAEEEKELAFEVNGKAVKYIAGALQKNNGLLIHISTDFVFNGSKGLPYREEDEPHPLSVYGASKLEGEKNAIGFNERTIIIRTSWVYSNDGHNFLNTMLRLGDERDQVNVVSDQIGAPTYTNDLAGIILKIALTPELEGKYGLYHYSNEGVASWYDFAFAIMQVAGLDCKVIPIETKDYKTAAKRPFYSLLNKSKIKSVFELEIPHWQESLQNCIDQRK